MLAGQPPEVRQWTPGSATDPVSKNIVKSDRGKHLLLTSSPHTHIGMYTCAHTLTPHHSHPDTYLGNSVSPYRAEWVFVCFSVLRMEPWFSPVLMHTDEALRPELRPQRGGNMLTDDDPHSWSQQRRRKRLASLRLSNTAFSRSVSTHRRRGACPLRRKNKAALTRYSGVHAEPSHTVKQTPPHTQLDATHVQVCAR